MKKYTIENKPSFKDQERVMVDMSCFGFPSEILEGKIVGKSFTHVIDNWLVEFPRRFPPEYIYSVVPVPHTFIVDPT